MCIQPETHTHTHTLYIYIYIYSEDITYHDTGNGWTFVFASAWKNSVNAAIGGVVMHIGPRALKPLNSIYKYDRG